MSRSFDKLVSQAFEGKTAAQLLATSPDALEGVSASDAEHLKAAFGVTTIRKLAELVQVDRARAILAAGGVPAFDPGPTPSWAKAFQQAPLGQYLQHPSARFRLDFGPVYYRGRLDGTARVLLVGQDPSTNELLVQRSFVGISGRRVQRFLAKIGIARSYVMLNTFLFPIFDTFDGVMENISLEPAIRDYRNSLFDKVKQENGLEAIVAVGKGAQHAVDHWPGKGNVPVFKIQHPSAHDAAPLLATWNTALPGLVAAVGADDGTVADPTPYGTEFTAADEMDIPRFDLPFGVASWQGTAAGSSSRDGDKKIIWQAP